MAVHEVDAEPLLAARPEGHQVVILVQRIGILPLVAFLPVLVDLDRIAGLLLGRNQEDAARLLPSEGRIDDGELALLGRVVAGQHGEDLGRVRDAPRVQDGRREIRVVAVELGLVRAVRVHLEQRLRIDLAAVVVLPARVGDQAVARVDLRVVGVHLVEADPAHEPAVAIHQEHVAHAHVPAVHVLEAAGGTEHDVAVGQVHALVVRHALPEGQLPDRARRDVHLVQVVVVAPGRLLPREQDALPVVRHVRVADHAVLVAQQHRLPRAQIVVQFEQAQAGAALEVELLHHAAGIEDVLVAHGIRVGVVRPAHVEVLGEDDAPELVAERTQQARSLGLAWRRGGLGRVAGGRFGKGGLLRRGNRGLRNGTGGNLEKGGEGEDCSGCFGYHRHMV